MNKITSKELAVTILFSLIILFGISLCIPALDNIAIKYIEKFFHKTLRDPARWIDVIQNTSRICIFTLCLIYFLSYFTKGIELCGKIGARLSEIKSQYFCRKTAIIFSILSLSLFIVYFNIITANYFFFFFVFRNYGGNRSWIGFSRYISEFGSIIIHNSLKLNDIAPLTQLLSILISSSAIMILSFALTEELKVKNLTALSLVFIAPFFAENISYRFDCPYMALSLFFAALPFLFKNDRMTFCFVSVISLLLTSFSYQAALTLYILCVLYLFVMGLYSKKDFKENFSFVLYAVASFIIAMLIFKLFFMNKMSNSDDDYFSSAISLSAFIPNSLQYIKTTFILNGGLLSKLLCLLSLMLLVINTIRTSKKRFAAFILVLATIVVSYILSFGPYLIFARSVFAARAFMGFNVFLGLILLANLEIASNLTKKSFIPAFITYATVYACTVFMFTYGNCLKNQKDYEDFRTKLIVQDLAEYSDKSTTYNISFNGSIGLSQKSRIALKNYPLISKMVPQRPTERHLWNEEVISVYNFKCTDKHTELTDDFILLKQTYYHDIYKSDNNYIVVLK